MKQSEKIVKKSKIARVNRVQWATFLRTLADTARIDKSLEKSGIDRDAAYHRRKTDSKFAQQWQEALESGYDMLEDVATGRAVDGVAEPIFYEGKICGHVQKYSDGLIQFLLKGNKPNKYRERFEATLNGNISLEQLICEAGQRNVTKGQGPSFLKGSKGEVPEKRKLGRPPKDKSLPPLNK